MAAARIGPNPWVSLYASHAPKIALWGIATTVFFAWPSVLVIAQKKGIWKV